MKKLLLLVSALVLTLGLAACGNGDKDPDPSDLSSLTISGVVDVEIEAETPFNVFTGVTVMGDDDVDYSDQITAESETCVIAENGDVDTSSAGTCVIVYTAVIEGIFKRVEMTLTIKPKVIIVVGPTLIEWDFQTEADLDGWEIYANGTTVEMTADNGAMKLVTTSGGNRWDTRIDFMNIPFEQGYDYKVSFMMKSSIDGKKVHLNLGELLPADPWFAPFKPEGVDIITLGTEYQEYFYTFTMSEDNPRGGILFEMGDIEGSVGLDATMWIKDLKIIGGSGNDTAAPSISGANDVILLVGETFDPTAGVTANDLVDGDLTSSIVVSGDTVDTSADGSFTVTYTVEDAAGNETVVNRVVDVVTFALDPNNNDRANVIFGTDGEITDDMANAWYKSVSWGQPIFTANIASGKLVMVSAKDGDKDYGSAPWDHIVRWTEMILVKDAVYKVVFDVSSDEDLATDVQQMMFKVEAGGFATETRFHVSQAGDTITYMFKYTGDNTIAGSLLFFVGGREHTITVENLEIYVNPTGQVTDTDPIVNGAMDMTVAAGSTVDLLAGITVSDVEDGAITIDASNVTVAGPGAETTFDSSVAGDWTVTYTVTDSDSNTVTKEVTITVVDFSSAPTVAHWSFATAMDMNGWNMDAQGGQTIEGMFDTDALKVTYTNGGNPWEPRLTFQGMDFEEGETYLVTFMAKSAEDGKVIHLQVGEILSGAPWFTNFDETPVYATLGTDWAEYSFIFTMPIDNQAGGLLFELGNNGQGPATGGTIWFKDIKVVGGTGADTIAPTIYGADDVVIEEGTAFDPLAGVTAYDLKDGEITLVSGDVAGTVDVNTLGEYTLTYTVTDAAGNTSAVVTRKVTVVGYVNDPNNDGVDGIFGTDTVLGFDQNEDWFLNVDAAPTFTASTTSGVLTVVHVKDGENALGNDLWNSIFRYQKLRLVNGAKYKIVFDGMTDVTSNTAESLLLKIEGAGASTETRFVLTDTSTSYEFAFTWEGPTTLDGLLLFMVGGQEHTLTFKNVNVLVNSMDAAMSYEPILEGVGNMQFDSGSTVDLMAGVTAFDVEDGVLVPVYSVVGPNGETTFDAAVDGIWKVTYTVTDADSNETSKTVDVVIGDFFLTSIIENSDMDQGQGWYVWYGNADWAGFATANYSLATGEAVINITNPGNQTWAVQFNQEGLTFGAAQQYIITFKAKADVARDINVELFAADTATGKVLQTVSITDTMTEYTVILAIPDGGSGKLSFQLGDINGAVAGTVTIDDVSLKMYDGSAATGDEMLVNTDMALNNLAGWTPTGNATMLTEAWGEATVHWDNAGGNPWDVKVEAQGLVFQDGATYMIVFDARAPQDRNFTVSLWDPTANATVYSSGPLAITAGGNSDWGWTRGAYVLFFTFNGVNPVNLEFQLGGDADAGNSFDFDNVMIYKLGSAPTVTGVTDKEYASGATIDLLDGVVAEDKDGVALTPVVTVMGPGGVTTFDGSDGIWQVTYTTTDADGAATVVEAQVVVGDFSDAGIITNGDMDEGQKWYVWYGNEDWAGYATANYSFVNGEAIINITNPGNQTWGVQFNQDGLTFGAGQQYIVTFYAKADAARDINVELFAADTATGKVQQTVSITDTLTMYTVILAIPDGGSGKLSFQLGAINGAVAGTVTITDVSVMEYDGSAATGSELLQDVDMTIYNLDGWTATANATHLSEAWGEATVHWTDQGSNPWDVKVEAQGLVFEDGATYKITFDVRAPQDRNFAVTLWDPTANTVVYTSGDLAITAAGNSDWGWTRGAYTLYFVFNGSNPVNFEFQLGGDADAGNTFDFDNVTIEKMDIPAS